MTNELVTGVFGGNIEIMDDAELLKGMEDTQDEGGRGGDFSFMSFSGKKGTYSIGIDKRQPGEDEPFLINASSFELGWMCWKDGKPVARRMANVRLAKIADPDFSENGPFNEQRGEGWQKARCFSARSFENGEEVQFTSSSKTGVSAMADLHKKIVEQIKSGQNAWPIVNFGSKDVSINGFNIPIPVMDVVKWLGRDDLVKLADPDFDAMSLLAEDDVKAPAPNKRRL